MNLAEAFKIRKKDFNLTLLAKVIIVFVFLGPILTPLLWLSNWPVFMAIGKFGWEFGKSFCTYTDKSFTLGGLPLMVCARCTGVAFGLITCGLLYHYTPLIKNHLPQKRLYLAGLIATLFIPWIIDSGLEQLELWKTDYWLLFPTGFLGGLAIILAPLLFLPAPEEAEEEEIYSLKMAPPAPRSVARA